MTDSRVEIHAGLNQAADAIQADRYDDAIAEMARLNDRFTIPHLPYLLERGQGLKRNKARSPEDVARIVEDLRRVAVELGP
ncbi:MAG: hypothetical protein KDB80_06420 [Planctomycetes bacterium]|nr:hypothetical protein [Planctomycetota bacterium]